MYSDILISTDKRTGIITLNRPERRNAMNDTMIKELTDAINSFSRQIEIRTIILTGAGESFCAGMDIKYILESVSKSHEDNIEEAKNFYKLLLSIQNAKKTVIAMVNGPAMGGGCGISAACDYVFAADSKAKFGVPEVRIGFTPAVILPFLVKRMGEGRTREFVLQGEVVDCIKAKFYGLVTDIVLANELSAFVYDFADKLASSTSPSSISLTKGLFMRMDEMNFRDRMEFALNLNAMARKTDDFQKGLETFLKKEKQQW